jgi:hypothetical protein
MAGIAWRILHATPAGLTLTTLSIAGITAEIVSKLAVLKDIGPRPEILKWLEKKNLPIPTQAVPI